MHHGVLSAPVDIYRQPVFHLLRARTCFAVMRTAVAQEIPAGAEETVDGVRLALGGRRTSGK